MFAVRFATLAAPSVALVVLASLLAYSQPEGTTEDARQFQYRYRPLRMGTQIQIEAVRDDRLIDRPLCSLGFPAYYEIIDYGLKVVTVYYGVVTASHCGYVNNGVYQNVTGADNYIGYMRDEGRYGLGDELANPNLTSDSTFIVVESYTYSLWESRPPPRIVSTLIQYSPQAWPYTETIPIRDYIRSEQDLRIAYQYQRVLYKSGRTTGLEFGRIIQCGSNQIVCRLNSGNEYYFLFNASTWRGDSGGPVFEINSVRVDGLKAYYAKVYGITVFVETSYCITDRLGNTLCGPTGASILYNITADLRIIPYSGG